MNKMSKLSNYHCDISRILYVPVVKFTVASRQLSSTLWQLIVYVVFEASPVSWTG